MKLLSELLPADVVVKFPAVASLRSKRFCGVFRALEPISEFWMRGKWGEGKTKMRGGRGGGANETLARKPHGGLVCHVK